VRISRVLSSPRRWGTISLGSALLRTSCSLPGTQVERAAPRPCLALLRMGFTKRLTLPPARCALTAPFHPYLCPEAQRPSGPSAVCSLWHFPSALAARALPGILPCGARTFLQRRMSASGSHSHATRSVSRPFRGRTTSLPLPALRVKGRRPRPWRGSHPRPNRHRRPIPTQEIRLSSPRRRPHGFRTPRTAPKPMPSERPAHSRQHPRPVDVVPVREHDVAPVPELVLTGQVVHLGVEPGSIREGERLTRR